VSGWFRSLLVGTAVLVLALLVATSAPSYASGPRECDLQARTWYLKYAVDGALQARALDVLDRLVAAGAWGVVDAMDAVER